MRASFTIAEILAATGGTLVHQGAWDTFCGVNTDSRTCQTGELFMASYWPPKPNGSGMVSVIVPAMRFTVPWPF